MLREHGVLWGGEKAKLVGLCMNPRAEGGAGAEDRLMTSHFSVDLRRWAEGSSHGEAGEELAATTDPQSFKK